MLQPPVTEYEVFSLLGPPDYDVSGDDSREYIYLFDRFAQKDWYCRIILSPDGVLRDIHYNATRTLDTGKLTRFPPFPRP